MGIIAPPRNFTALQDYELVREGANAVAYDKGGVLAFRGTDHAKVFQEAINSLRGNYGLVTFKERFEFLKGIEIFPGIGLQGPGPIALNTTETDPIIAAGPALNEPIIKCIVDPEHPTIFSFPYFRGFTIQGRGGAANPLQHGILLTEPVTEIKDGFLDEVLIFETGGHGLLNETGAKLWVDKCYFEKCNENGVRYFRGQMRFTNCYFFGNKKFGVDSHSASRLFANDNYFNENGEGAIFCELMAVTARITDNEFLNNGNNTHPAIVCNQMSGAGGFICNDNTFVDTRAAGEVTNFFVSLAGTAAVTKGKVLGNNFSGQKAGNRPVSITARATNNITVDNNQGLNNTAGKIASPFSTTATKVGIEGTLAAPVASTAYTVNGTPLILTSTAGAGVSITILDPAGNTVTSGVATLTQTYLPVGYSINFGAFAEAPTVNCFIA